jgi:hypothetical protein
MAPNLAFTTGQPGFNDYKLDERRTDTYTFTSIKGIYQYFSSWLDKEEIKDIIEDAKSGFTHRSGASKEIDELQFIKKCEYLLVRTLRKSGGR